MCYDVIIVLLITICQTLIVFKIDKIFKFFVSVIPLFIEIYIVTGLIHFSHIVTLKFNEIIIL